VIPLADVVGILAIAGGAALAVALVGAGALAVVRRRPLAAGLAVLVLTIVGAGAAATSAVGLAMFLSPHDLRVLLVVVVVAAAAGTTTAILLTRRLVAAVRDVAGVARALAGDEPVHTPRRPLPAEFAALVGDLVTTADRLRAARQRERALEASRRELVGWVSHDLRTPLAGLRAMVEALEDGVVSEPDEVAAYHRHMRAEIDRLTAMVNDLFELSRLHAGTSPMPVEPTALADVVSDALATADPVARARGVRLVGAVHGDGVRSLPASSLARVLANLVSNAVRHTPGGGTVIVEGAVDDEGLRLAVQDECGGIPESDLARVFDDGFRGTPARSPGEGAGGGVGLSIARGLAETTGGTVEVTNRDGGCRFTLRLAAPAAEARLPRDGDRRTLSPSG
jgi:signal transduction histidine kinase